MKIILVPGSAIVEKKDRIEPDQRYKSRLLSAFQLYEPDSVIVISGGVYDPSEAEVGKTYLNRFGIPSANIVTCCNARDTYENAREFKEATSDIEEPEFHLVTNGFHASRAAMACRLFGIRPEVHPTEDILKSRYSRFLGESLDKDRIKGVRYAIQNASEMKTGEEKPNLIGLIAAYIDCIISLAGRTRLHPINHLIARVLGYDKRNLKQPPDFNEWDQKLYPKYEPQ